jgi:co-chaperonin GroES (HSP10)
MDKDKNKKKINFNVIPNSERVIIRLIQQARISPVLLPGQLKAGENLHCGEIIDPGETKFKKGQIVYYSEYSASQFYNLGSVFRGEQTMGEVMNEAYFIVSADDIMAYEKDIFEIKKEEVDIRKLEKDFKKNQREVEIPEEPTPSPTIIIGKGVGAGIAKK